MTLTIEDVERLQQRLRDDVELFPGWEVAISEIWPPVFE